MLYAYLSERSVFTGLNKCGYITLTYGTYIQKKTTTSFCKKIYPPFLFQSTLTLPSSPSFTNRFYPERVSLQIVLKFQSRRAIDVNVFGNQNQIYFSQNIVLFLVCFLYNMLYFYFFAIQLLSNLCFSPIVVLLEY